MGLSYGIEEGVVVGSGGGGGEGRGKGAGLRGRGFDLGANVVARGGRDDGGRGGVTHLA